MGGGLSPLEENTGLGEMLPSLLPLPVSVSLCWHRSEAVLVTREDHSQGNFQTVSNSHFLLGKLQVVVLAKR